MLGIESCGRSSAAQVIEKAGRTTILLEATRSSKPGLNHDADEEAFCSD